MRYEKPHLSFEHQADLLISRGLIAERDELIMRLKTVGYYRLSAYAYPYRSHTEGDIILDAFSQDTTLDKIWLHYRFDRDLRRHFLDAIERIEVSLRCLLAYYHTESGSPFNYASAAYFPNWWKYQEQVDEIASSRKLVKKAGSSGKEYVDHFFNKYGDQHDYLPLWMAVGNADFGFLCRFFQNSGEEIQEKIADEWGMPTRFVPSWLNAIRDLRNDCAHHARVWNKYYTKYPPSLPTFSENKKWYYEYLEKAHKWVKPPTRPTPIIPFLDSHSTACFLFMCSEWLRAVAPTSHWRERVQNFLLNAKREGVDIERMGLPTHWEMHPLWQGKSK